MSGDRIVLELTIVGAKGPVGSPIFTSPEKISLGRDPRAMVHLDHPSVSLRHAVLSLDGDGVSITDVGSRSGTWVNGRAITGGQMLRPSDEINIGPFRIRQTIHRSQAAAAQGDAGGGRNLSVPTPYEPFPPSARPASSAKPERVSAPEEEEVTRVGRALVRDEPEGPKGRQLDTRVDLGGGIDDLLADSLATDRPREPEKRARPAPAVESPTRETDLSRIDRLLAEALGPEPQAEKRADKRPERRAERPAEARPEKRADRPAEARPEKRAERPVEARAERPVEKPVERPVEKPVAADARPRRGEKPAEKAVAAAVVDRAAAREADAGKRARTEKAPESRAVRSLPPPSAGVEHDEDDEDDDSMFVPPFDLLEVLSRGTAPAETAADAPVAVEVARFRADRVLSIRHIARGKSLTIAGSPVALGEYLPDGRFILHPKSCGPVTVRQGGRRLSADEQSALARDGSLRVVAGMEVVVDLDGGDGLLVHLVDRAPALAPSRPAMRPVLDRALQGAFSVAVHLLIVVIVGLTVLAGKSSEAADVNEGRFAQIKVPDVEVVPPPPPPPPPPEPVADSPLVQAPNQPPAPQSKHNPKQPTNEKSEPQENSAPSDSAQKILKALGAAAPAGPDLGALSNLDAVSAHGSSTGFKVSDSVGKAPGDTLRLGGGNGSAEVNTKSASEIGSDVGRLHVQTSGVVRARVTAPPAAARVEGRLDRGEIQKVVNAHLAQVQACYERQLMKNSGLSGKVSFRWVISPTGSVASVRVAQSSIPSTEVISCIQSAIGGWQFPAPDGGSVTVTYPFGFTTFGN